MIIILNGTSSSGKTSIAKELLKQLQGRYFFFSVDNFLTHSMPEDINLKNKDDLILLNSAISGFNKAFGPISKHIPNIIIDHVLQEEDWLKEISTALKNVETFFVHVTAPLEVVEEREATRGDRALGTARKQYDQIEKHQYDFKIDTSLNTPEVCAQMIIKNLTPGQALKSQTGPG